MASTAQKGIIITTFNHPHKEQSPESGFYFRKNDPEHLAETIV